MARDYNIPYRGTPLITKHPILDSSRKPFNSNNMCRYLENRIAYEETALEKYEILNRDLPEDVSQYGYVPILIDLQRKEIHYLKAIYSKLCTYAEAEPHRYAIWYFNGIDYYPASGKFNVEDVYANPENAVHKARELAQEYYGENLSFGVYPVNHNDDISGKAIMLFNTKSFR